MEDYLTQITNYLLTQSWQIALLVVTVATASLLLKNKSAHIRYLLWLIVLAKCLVPPLLTIPLAILPQREVAKPLITAPSEILPAADTSLTTEPVPVVSMPLARGTSAKPTIMERLSEITVRQWLALAWIVGAGVFVLVVVIKALRTNRWLRRERKSVGAQLQGVIEDFFAELRLEAVPKVWLIDGIGQPFVWGLLRGSIYLPGNFAKNDSTRSCRDILGHEISHILQFDAAVNLLQIIAQGIFWFHPFVWWANREIRAEREKCCDEMAIARLGALPKDYSTAIVNTLIAEHRATQPIPSLAVAGPVKNIEDRIKTIMKPGKKFYKRPSLIAAIAVLLVAALAVPTTLALTTRSAGKSKQKDYSLATVEEGTGFDDIIAGDPNCTREFIKSKLGEPDKEAKDKETKGWWLDYRKKCGLDFWLDRDNILYEIRLNKGFKGKLASGISLSSTKEDVFKMYGEPVSEKTVEDLTKHFENQVLYKKTTELRWFRKQQYSKIFYNQHSLLFWFDGDKINQIVIYPKDISTQKLMRLGRAIQEYAEDHSGKYPDSMHELQGYMSENCLKWLVESVEYLGKGKTTVEDPSTLIAYDRILLEKGNGTTVLFLDGHVEFCGPERLEKLDVVKAAIEIESRFILLPPDANEFRAFFEKQGIQYPFKEEPNSAPYFVSSEEAEMLLRLIRASSDATLLTAPKVTVLNGEEASVAIQRRVVYTSGYTEPNSPSDEPKPKRDSVTKGTRLKVKPNLLADNENIRVETAYEISDIIGYEKHMYRGKRPYEIPVIQKSKSSVTYVAPAGQTVLLIGPNVKTQNEQGQIVEKKLLVLIKAVKVHVSAD